MGLRVDALFTSALGLQPPWVIEPVKLDVPTKRIDFEVSCGRAAELPGLRYGLAARA